MKLDYDRRVLVSCTALIGFVEVFFLFFPDRLLIPQETHFLVARLTEIQNISEPSSVFYGLLVTPIYYLLNEFFQNPYLYILLSYFTHSTFSLYIFVLVFFIIKKPIPAFLLWCFFSPLFSVLAVKLFGLNIIPSPKGAFEWGNVTFTIRLLFGFVYSGLVYCYFTERVKSAYFLSALAFLIHPNSAIFSFLILMSCEIILYFQNRITFSRVLGLIVIGSVCLALVLLKIKETDHLGIVEFDGFLGYKNFIRDESDDFSIYYYFLYAKSQLLIYSVFYLATVLTYQRFCEKKLLHDSLFLISFVPYLLYALGLLCELILLERPNNFLISALLGLQPGYKLLGFSFFPLLFIWARILSKGPNLQNRLSSYVIGIIMVLGLFSSVLILDNNKNLLFLKEVKSIDIGPISYAKSLILRSKMTNQLNPSVPKIYYMGVDEDFSYNGEFDLRQIKIIESFRSDAKLDEEFNKKYNSIIAFEHFIDLTIENIPAGSGIIIPPYMFNIRDSLSNYNVFLQEHHDGNVMLGSLQAATLFLGRMKDLLGETYLTFPTQESGLNYSYMRKKYYELDSERLDNLTLSYPEFSYIVVEKQQLIDKAEIASNEYYAIYKIGI